MYAYYQLVYPPGEIKRNKKNTKQLERTICLLTSNNKVKIPVPKFVVAFSTFNKFTWYVIASNKAFRPLIPIELPGMLKQFFGKIIIMIFVVFENLYKKIIINYT